MIIYLDESGYTGPNLLDPAQPVFVGASTNLCDDAAEMMVRECFPGRSRELKHSELCKTRGGQDRIVKMIQNMLQRPDNTAVSVFHKEFVVLALLIDHWVEPAMREDNINLYEKGANIALSNAMYQVLRLCLQTDERKELYSQAQEMLRTKSPEAYSAFWTSVRNAQERAQPLRDVLDYLVCSDAKLGGYEHLTRLPSRITDPGTMYFMEQVGFWSARTEDNLYVVHDESSALAREQQVWETLLAADVPSAVVGQDRRTIKFPLRVDSVTPADSRDHLQLQIADVVAGAVATSLRYRAGGETTHRSAYIEKLDAIPLLSSSLIINAVWPSFQVTPEQLDTEGETHADAATHVARILRIRGVKHPAAVYRGN